MIRSIHKASVLAKVRITKLFTGYIAPYNVNSFHINGGWHIGHSVLITIDRNDSFYEVNPYYMKTNGSKDCVLLAERLHNYAWNNCSAELGHRVKFWEDVIDEQARS
jgi:hypothetical protein